MHFPAGLELSPDLVVLEFLPGNDVRNNHSELERICNQESASALWRNSNRAIDSGFFSVALLLRKLGQATRNVSGRREHLDSGVYQETPTREPKLWAEAWAQTETLLTEIRDLCRSKGAELLVVNFCAGHEVSEAPSGSEALPGVDFALPARRVAAICERLEVPFYDTTPDLREATKEGSVTYEHDGHWNSRGHKAAATGTAEFIAKHPKLRALLDRP